MAHWPRKYFLMPRVSTTLDYVKYFGKLKTLERTHPISRHTHNASANRARFSMGSGGQGALKTEKTSRSSARFDSLTQATGTTDDSG